MSKLLLLLLVGVIAYASAQEIVATEYYNSCNDTLPYFINVTAASTCTSQTPCSGNTAVTCYASNSVSDVALPVSSQVLVIAVYANNSVACMNETAPAPMYWSVYPFGMCGPVGSNYAPDNYTYARADSCTQMSFCHDSACTQCDLFAVYTGLKCFGWYGGDALSTCYTSANLTSNATIPISSTSGGPGTTGIETPTTQIIFNSTSTGSEPSSTGAAQTTSSTPAPSSSSTTGSEDATSSASVVYAGALVLGASLVALF